MKSEKALGEVLKSVAKECHSDPIEQQLKKIGKAFIYWKFFFNFIFILLEIEYLVHLKQLCENCQCG